MAPLRIVTISLVALGATAALADDLLYRYEGNVLPYDASAGWWLGGGDAAAPLPPRGLCATTCSGGAGKCGLPDAEPLCGHNVPILPDNDDSGHDHANDVAQRLQGIAAEVKIVDLPGLGIGEDVSDWLEAGHMVEDFA